MKKLLGIVVLVLMWCNVGFAETRLDCKYYDSIRITHTETTSTYSGELKNIIKYITIILDMENKKIIKTYSQDSMDNYGSQLKWEESHITWYKKTKLENEKKLIEVSGTLDRYTGRYEYNKKIHKYSGVPYSKDNPLKIDLLEEIKIAFKCEVKKTKF